MGDATAGARRDAERLRQNLQGEVDSASLYRAMAQAESNPHAAELYRRLAQVEEGHASFWRKRLEAAGVRAADPAPDWRTRVLIWAARRFGAEAVLPTAASLESIDRHQYDDQPETKATGMPSQERSHARLLSRLSSGRRGIWDSSTYAQLEGRHLPGSGNALRAAVLGANDGLVSNLSLIMGVSGATASQQSVLLAGVAGLLAGACSMAMGEWLSVQNARELYRRQLSTEADELAQVPDEEREELVLIYQAKGLPAEQARALADKIMSNRDTALDTLAREELGIDPGELGGSAWSAAASSFLVFTLGATIPLLPFVFASGAASVVASAALSAVALFGIGAAVTVFTGRSALFSGTRQVVIGLAAAAVTYSVGRVLGATILG
ncbi:MAG TPA: VIT1/CCC1 family protein [Burkholderiales bacterium]|nr:VIT1/CCC1 family protein [Burkholderiales bacterium]